MIATPGGTIDPATLPDVPEDRVPRADGRGTVRRDSPDAARAIAELAIRARLLWADATELRGRLASGRPTFAAYVNVVRLRAKAQFAELLGLAAAGFDEHRLDVTDRANYPEWAIANSLDLATHMRDLPDGTTEVTAIRTTEGWRALRRELLAELAAEGVDIARPPPLPGGMGALPLLAAVPLVKVAVAGVAVGVAVYWINLRLGQWLALRQREQDVMGQHLDYYRELAAKCLAGDTRACQLAEQVHEQVKALRSDSGLGAVAAAAGFVAVAWLGGRIIGAITNRSST